jgi:hypothetical protein
MSTHIKEFAMRLAEKLVQGKAVPLASSAIGKEETVTSRARDLLSHDWDTPDRLSASPVQRDYTRKQERVVLALIIVLVVISLIGLYILWVKASGTQSQTLWPGSWRCARQAAWQATLRGKPRKTARAQYAKRRQLDDPLLK